MRHRVYILAGDQERAIDQLEPLLKMPYFLSPGWLRIDPTPSTLCGAIHGSADAGREELDEPSAGMERLRR